jgi:hypothetical protein
MARISTLAVVAGAVAALALAADSASAGSNTVHITVPTVPTGNGHTQWTEPKPGLHMSYYPVLGVGRFGRPRTAPTTGASSKGSAVPVGGLTVNPRYQRLINTNNP